MVSFRGRETLPKLAPAPAASPPPVTASEGKINRKLTQKLLGCWRKRSSTGGSTGSSNSSWRYYFDNQGNYSYTYRSFVSTPYGSSRDGDDDEGRYAVVGSTLHFKSNDASKSDGESALRFRDGFVYMDDTRYIPCN